MRILVVNLLFWLFIGGLSSCNSGTDPHTLRLKLLADTQQGSNDLMLNDIGELINRIQADVESHGNSPHDIALLNEADTLLVRTKATAGRIRNMQVAVLSKLGRRNYFQDLESHVLVEKVLLQAGVPTSADSLYFHLQSFTAYAKQLDPQALKSSWLLPEDAGYLTPASRLLDGPTNFRDFYFKGTTTAEALAMLAQQETQVLQTALGILKQLSSRVSSGLVVHPRIGAYAVAESRTVRPGEKYVADLLLVRGAGRPLGVRMTMNGDTLPVEPDGRGRVEFIVPHQQSKGENTVLAHWDGAISLRYQGRDTTFRVRVPYTIRQD